MSPRVASRISVHIAASSILWGGLTLRPYLVFCLAHSPILCYPCCCVNGYRWTVVLDVCCSWLLRLPWRFRIACLSYLVWCVALSLFAGRCHARQLLWRCRRVPSRWLLLSCDESRPQLPCQYRFDVPHGVEVGVIRDVELWTDQGCVSIHHERNVSSVLWQSSQINPCLHSLQPFVEWSVALEFACETVDWTSEWLPVFWICCHLGIWKYFDGTSPIRVLHTWSMVDCIARVSYGIGL